LKILINYVEIPTKGQPITERNGIDDIVKQLKLKIAIRTSKSIYKIDVVEIPI
jgi:hypothetical protein